MRRLNLVVQQTVRLLRAILETETEPEIETGLLMGSRVDIKKYAEFRLFGDPHIFQEIREPERPDYVFSIVVDESGSMGGEKGENAIDAEVIFMEVLARLNIRHSIMGFGCNHWMHKEFDTTPNMVERERIYQQLERAMGGGGGTNDFEALQEAIKQIKGEPAEHKVIIVITDGDGNLFSEEGKKMLEQAEREGIKIIGIGIGDGMGYVKIAYLHHILPPVIDQLPIAIRDILVREISRGR